MRIQSMYSNLKNLPKLFRTTVDVDKKKKKKKQIKCFQIY